MVDLEDFIHDHRSHGSLTADATTPAWFCGVLGPYRCPVITFRILARSNIKDSMTFLIAEPPLRRADRQRCQGDPAHTNAPARHLHRQQGHQAAPGLSWLPASRRIGGWSSPGDSLPADCGTQDGGSGQFDGHRRRRGEVLDPIQGHY